MGRKRTCGMKWQDFCELVKQKFYPMHLKEQIEEKFLNLRMKGAKVREYTKTFFKYSQLVPYLAKPESNLIQHNIWGLVSEIRDTVKVAMPRTIDSVVELAGLLIDRMVRTQEENKEKEVKKKGDQEMKRSDKKSGRKDFQISECKICKKKHLEDGTRVFKSECPKINQQGGNEVRRNQAGRNQAGGSGVGGNGGAKKGNARAFVLNTREVAQVPDVITGFDFVLGMEWLATNQARILRDKKAIELRAPPREKITIYGDKLSTPIRIISVMKAAKCIRKGCLAYLISLSTGNKENKIEDVPVVAEYADVFPDELPGLPPDREVEFKINLIPGTTPIAKSPYRLAPTKMQELKKQLEELLEKGFISVANPFYTLFLIQSRTWSDPILY
ncbi:uncharacterized protein LOC110866827 [Helianthus annuus]|uniref:uncharacterized protein LOC110866827 n=1 Tax=Helianthus annuus TaxID=4232 RepID=UPI000B902FC2|nr:uncharacterized protein LOC110866827 [Helianthus annuus]